jgi:hypothetical protein
MAGETGVSPARSASRRYSGIVIGAIALLMLIACAMRLNAHRTHIDALSRAADDARANARAYADASNGLVEAGKRVGTKYTAAFDAMSNASKNGFGYLAVIKERLDALRADKEIDKAITAAKRHFPHPDDEFNTRADKALAKEQAARDQMTSSSAMIGAIMSNPFMALALNSGDAQSAGYRLGKAAAEAGTSWRAVKARAGQLRDASANQERHTQAALRAQRSKGIWAAIVDP